MTATGLAATAAHLLSGIALALAFCLLPQRRAAGLVATVRAQGVAVTLAAAALAGATVSVLLGVLAVGLLVAMVALPWALRRAAAWSAPLLPPKLALGGAALLTVLALLAVPTARQALAPALAAALVALLLLATRRDVLGQSVGLLALANAVALAGLAVGGPVALATLAPFAYLAVALGWRTRR